MQDLSAFDPLNDSGNQDLSQFDPVATPAAPAQEPQFDARLGLMRRMEKPEAVKDYSHVGDFEAGVGAGVKNMKAMWNGFLAATGQAVGNDDLKAYGLAGMQENEAEAQLYQQGRATQVEGVDDVGSFLDYAQYTLGNLAPFALESALSAIAGAVAGTSVPGAGNVAGGVGGFFMRKQVKDAIRNYAKGQVRDAAEEAMAKQALARMGAAAGAVVGGYPLHVGDAYNETVEAGDPNAGAAFGAAVPMAALDAVVPAGAVGRVMGVGKGNLAARAAKGAVADAVKEGATELGQEEVLLQLRGQLDPDFELTGPEAQSRRANSAVSGFIGGAATGGASGALSKESATADPVQADATEDLSQFDPLAEEAAPAEPVEEQRLGLRGVLERTGRTWNEYQPREAEPAPAEPKGLNAILADKPGAMRAARERRLQGEIQRSALPFKSEPLQTNEPAQPAPYDNFVEYRKPEPDNRTAELAGSVERAITETQNEYGRAARSGRLPEGLRDGRLLRMQFRNELENMAKDLVKGGGVSYVRDENEQIVGRTGSVNPDWFKALSDDKELSMSTESVRSAVDKALKGERLGVRQARVVGSMLDNITGRREEYARKLQVQRDAAREARRALQDSTPIDPAYLGYDPVAEAGEVYEENDYLEEAAYIDRAISEMADDAVNAGASYDDVAQIIDNKSTVAAMDELQRLILRMRNEHRHSIGRPVAEVERTADEARSGSGETASESLEGETTDPAREARAEVVAPAKQLEEAVAQAATSPANDLPEPSDAQKEAGNYRKAHVKVLGLDIAIENPRDSTRSGTSASGKRWESKMAHHYGYVKRTTGADGDQVDVFVGENPDSDRVFVIDQKNQDGAFDEHKVMLGFDSLDEADAGYHANYEKGWTGRGAITEMSADEFKQWLKEGDTSKPVAYAPEPEPVVSPGRQEKPESTEQSQPEIDTDWKTASAADVLDGIRSIHRGELSYDQYRSLVDAFRERYTVLRDELAGMKKQEILDLIGPAFAYRNKNDRKGDVAESAIRAMGDGLGITGSMSHDMSAYRGLDAYMGSVFKNIDQVTRDQFDKRMEKNRAEAEEQQREHEKALAGMDDPKTLEDFIRVARSRMSGGKPFTEARMEFSVEQRAEFDRLAAEKSRSERGLKKETRKTEIKTASQKVDGQIIETKHTKKGHDLFVVQLGERVDRDDYNKLNANAKRLGGYYSSFRGGGAVPGFQFTDRENAEAFSALLGGDTAKAEEIAKENYDAFADDKKQSAVERLRTMAEAMDARADETLSADRKVNTARRANMAAGIAARAESEKAMAETMRRLADGLDGGSITFLDGVRQKVQVEMLDRFLSDSMYRQRTKKYSTYGEQEKHKYDPADNETADFVEFPVLKAYRSDLARLGRQLADFEGAKKISAKLLKVADDVTEAYLKFAKENFHKVSTFTNADGQLAAFKSKAIAEEAIARSGFRGKAIVFPVKRGENAIIMSPDAAREKGVWEGSDDQVFGISTELADLIIEKTNELNRGRHRIDVPWSLSLAHERRKRLSAMNIETPAELRAAMREYIGLKQYRQQPSKVQELERSMVGRKNDGLDFFPTPEPVVMEMLDAAEVEPGMSVLEPSAGMGHIAEHLRDAGADLDVVEFSADRRELLELKGFNVVGSDFLDVSGDGYDRIIMNPPFSDRRDAEHVQHAYSLLKPGGRIVAIMGEGVFFGQDKKAQAFRGWLDDVEGESSKLPEGSFMDASLPVTTGVNARMVVINKPAAPAEPGGGRFSKKSETPKPERAPWGDFPDVVHHAFLGTMKNEPEYPAAKKGDAQAALALVRRVMSDDAVERLRALIGDRKPIVQPVLAVERAGTNKIPLAFAQVLAHRLGLSVGTEVYQAKKVGRTDSGADHRLAHNPVYLGDVVPGQDYLIVDDTLTMGGTLASLRGYIQNRGGNVIAASVVTAHPGAVKLPVSEKLLNKVRNKHGEALENYWKSEFGYPLDQLTQGEAGHLGKAKDVDSIRDRIVAARDEGSQRLDGGRTGKSGTSSLDPSGGMTVEAVEAAIAKRVLSFKNNNLAVRVVADESALPDSAHFLMEERGDEVAPRGFYDANENTVYLVADQLASADVARATLEHEAVGHLAVEMLLGSDFRPFVEKVMWLHKSGDKTVRHAARLIEAEYGADWKKLDEVDRGAEVIAKMAELRLEGNEFSKRAADLWTQVVQAVKRFMSRFGFEMDFGISDVNDVLIQAGALLRSRKGRMPAGQSVGFSKASEGSKFAKAAVVGNELMESVDAGAPIDRAFRKAFDLAGLVNEQGTFDAPQKTKALARAVGDAAGRFYDQKMPWSHHWVNIAKRGLIDRYGLDLQYLKEDDRRAGNERRLLLQAQQFLENLKIQGVDNHEEAKVLHAILTGKDVDRDDLKALAQPIREAIDAMGQEAVELGLISEEAYQRNAGSYLHRSYMKHEDQETGLSRWASSIGRSRRRKIVGNQLKQRGLTLKVDPAKLGALREADVVQVFEAENGRRRYAEAGTFPPEGWRDMGVFEVRRDHQGVIVGLWRDWTEEERQSMGEILDARYAIAKTYRLMAHDLAVGRFYKSIAENSDWSKSELEEGDTEVTRTSRFGGVLDDGAWVKVPDVKIPKSGARKWGALAGKYVRSEIWRDLNELEAMNRPSFWQKLMTQWKLNKTARNPVVHLNNVMSNLLFMDMADVRMRDLYAALKSMRDQDQDYKEALENGAFGSGFVDHELRRGKLDEILAEIKKQATNNKGFWESALPERVKTVGKIMDGIWGGMDVKVGGKVRRIGVKPADEAMMDAYQMEDEMFRMATYLRRRALGDDVEAAAHTAREQFLNYDIRAPWINLARQSVLPFIGYTYRAVPVIAKSLAARPWKIAKYIAVAEAVNALGYALAPGDEDEERRALSEDQQGDTWLGTPRMLRMPFRDGYGDPVFLDVRRWIPAGDVFDTNVGQAAVPIPAPLQWSGPLMLAAELMLNKQAFTGKEIVNEKTDDGMDKMRKVADWGWKSWMPSAVWVPNSWYWEKMEKSLEGGMDSAGRVYSVPLALSSSFGLKIQPLNVEQSRFFQSKGFDQVERALKYELSAAKRLRERGMLSGSEYQSEVWAIRRKLKELDEERSRVLVGK